MQYCSHHFRGNSTLHCSRHKRLSGEKQDSTSFLPHYPTQPHTANAVSDSHRLCLWLRVQHSARKAFHDLGEMYSSIQHLCWHTRTGLLSGRELCFLQHLSDPRDSLARYQILVLEGCNSTGFKIKKPLLLCTPKFTYRLYYRNQFLRKITGHNSYYYTYYAHQLHQFSNINLISKGKVNPLQRFIYWSKSRRFWTKRTRQRKR